MRLAVCITVFNGLSLLEQCIQNYKKSVQDIILCYQLVSHIGRKIDQDAYEKIMEIGNSFGCTLIQYDPIILMGVKENERMKHNQMISKAREIGATHFIMSATDHFYKDEDIFYGMKIVSENGYDVTLTSMYTYYKHPTWQLTPKEDYYMPFICKFNLDTRIARLDEYPYYVDPSVKVFPITKPYLFREPEVMLHHYSMVRDDLKEDKFRDAVSPRWTPGLMEKYLDEYRNYDIEKNPGVSYFKGRKIRIVEDFFHLLG